MRVLSFGEIIWDVFPDDKHLGGAPLNLAAHCALQGADAFVISATGRDRLGKELLEGVKNLGVSTKYISENEKTTGKCIVTISENTAPKYQLLSDVSYDYIKAPDISGESFDVLAFGTLALRTENNKKALKDIIGSGCFSEIYSDINIRPPHYSKDSINFALKNATIVKISDEELPVITNTLWNLQLSVNDSILKLAEHYQNLKIIILTLGEKGSVAYDCKDKKLYKADAVKTSVKSTVGAGDSFGATFLTSYFKGLDIQSCLNYASKVSAYVVSNQEAIPKNMSEFLKTVE